MSRAVAVLSIASIAVLAGRAAEPSTDPAAAARQPAPSAPAETASPGPAGTTAPSGAERPPDPLQDPVARRSVAEGLARALARLRNSAGPGELPPASVSQAIGAAASVVTPRGHEASAVVTQLAANGIPSVSLQAYQDAAVEIDGQLPGCHLPWTLLAAIGRIESGHGQANGARLTPQGDALPPILGPRLVGGSGMARILDTDGGRLDGDTEFDRAVGPMQFLPSTWAVVGVDGNGDGRADPNNVYDAALSAAAYLCASGRDLANPDQLRAAVRSYNHSDAYVAQVLALAAAYAANGPIPLPVDWAPATTPPSSGPASGASGSASPSETSGPPSGTASSGPEESGATSPAGAAPTTEPTSSATASPPVSSGASCPAPPATSSPPATTGPTTAGPTTTGPTTTGPTTTGPTTTAPATTAPATTAPTTTGPATTGTASTGPSSTGPSSTGAATTGPSASEPTATAASSTTPSGDVSATGGPTATSTTTTAPPTGPPTTTPPTGPPSSTAPPAAPTGLGVDPVLCATDPVTTAATPTLTARAAGDASGAVAYTFQVWAVDHDTEPLASGTVSVAAGEAARWAPAADLLEPGGRYTFRVRASVGDISSDWSESLPFVVTDA